jgi:hypothetical protein
VIRTTCPEWLDSDLSLPVTTWCGRNKHLKSSWKRSSKRTHTVTHTHTLPTPSLTHPYIYTVTLSSVSHTDRLELLLHLKDLIPCPSLQLVTINHVDKLSHWVRYHFWLISHSHYQQTALRRWLSRFL